ncbi:MAG: ferrous iron transport protein A [Proteobacteria bacterium]|nr:ferrous iron transport protein A [Pseudomonadota bacterium]
MLTLDAIPIGKPVRMKGFGQHAQGFRQKLLAMGLTPGVLITILRVAPLGDPLQILLRGYTLSLRKKECQQIEVEYAHGKHPSEKQTTSPLTNCACRES